MQEKLIKLIEIKIDAIDKNIESLNYLNDELDHHNNDLEYLNKILSLVDTGDILDFDKISQDDFNQVISMISEDIALAFENKTCNYQGIMYIIRGIRDEISLELTELQIETIHKFIDEIKNTIKNFNEKISELEECKEKLPETDLNVLETDLIKFKNIIESLNKNDYLMQIEDIIEVIDFTQISVLEKIDVFSYIMKYNRDIYEKVKPKGEISEEKIGLNEIKIDNLEPNEVDFFTDKDFDLPSLNLDKKEVKEKSEDSDLKTNINDTIDIEDIIQKIDLELKKVLENDKEDEKEKEDDLNVNSPNEFIDNENNDSSQDIVTEKSNKEEIKLPDSLSLDSLSDINFEEFKLPERQEIPEIEHPIIEKENDLDNKDDITNLNNAIIDNNNFNAFTNFSDYGFNDLENKTNENLPTFDDEKEDGEIEKDLNDKEISNSLTDNIDTKNENNLNIINDVLNINPIADLEKDLSNNTDNLKNINQMPELLDKYELDLDLKTRIIENPNLKYEDISDKLVLFDEDKLLNILKDKKDLLYDSLLNTKDNLSMVLSIIKKELIIREEDYADTLEIILETMPLIFTNANVSKAFISNIDFYKENKINLINLFDNYRELLIIDTNSLKDNLEIVKSYGLTVDNDNVKYLLCNKNILKNLDYYIEAMGHEKGFLSARQEFDGISYIKTYPYKLNMISRDTLMKLRYATKHNIKIYGSKPGKLAGEIANPKVDVLTLTPEYKNEYFDNEYEFIDRSEMLNLKEEIEKNISINLSIDEIISKLENSYKISDLRYKINDLYFSRIKTIRLYNYLLSKNLKPLHALIIGLTFNSVITKDEYLGIEKLITELVGGNE